MPSLGRFSYPSQIKKTALAAADFSSGFANLAIVGDSNDSAMLNRSATVLEHQAHGWGTWVGPQSFQRVQVVWNEATGGQEILPDPGQTNGLATQIDNFLSSPVAAVTTHVSIKMGTNDADTQPSVVAQELARQVKRLDGYRVLLHAVPPAGAGANSQTTFDGITTRGQWIMRMNQYIKQIAKNNPFWITFIDDYGIMVDSASATGQAKAGMLYDDATVGLHYNNLTAQRISQAVVNSICKGMPEQYDWLTSAGDVSSLQAGVTEKSMNINPNGLFTASAGGLGTGYTESVNAGVTHTASIVAHPNGFGNCQQLSISATAQNGFSRLQGPSFNTQLSPGDSIWGQMWIRIPGNSGLCAPRLLLTVVVDGVTYTRTCFANVMANAAQIDGCDLLVRTPTLDLPAGVAVTTANLQLTNFAYQAGTANSNLLVGQVECRKIINLL